MNEGLGGVVESLLALVLGVDGRVVYRELSDELVASRHVDGIGDRWTPRSEELLRVELYLVPWGVADYTAEAAVPALRRSADYAEDMRELYVPVEEAVLAG